MTDGSPATGARDEAIEVLEYAIRGEVDGARKVIANCADVSATASELARLLALLLPSYPVGEMVRFVQTARKFDPLG